MNFTTVQVYSDAISAHILCNKLESEGIECFIKDEHIVTMNPLYSNAVGGIKVQVRELDVQLALDIIKELKASPFLDEQDVIIACPNCSSTEVYSDFKSMKGVYGIFSAIVSFLLAVFPIYYKSVYRCKKCDTEFKPNAK
ncbi:MAG: DUF2007 domain-containing protein [Bacteroidota bacterium]